nr:LysR family transcriptional regulator [Raineyella fluvialis]
MSEDLNSLRTLVMLYETRSVTASAEQLQVSQPTVSYTLARLRRRFGDDLFRREGNTLVPTSRATRLYDELHEPLARIEQVAANSVATSFDPTALHGELVLALSSMGEISWLPIILRAVERAAPGVRLRVTPLAIDSVEEDLVRGVVDLAITMTVLRTDRIWRETFFDVQYVAVTGAAHPLGPGRRRCEAGGSSRSRGGRATSSCARRCTSTGSRTGCSSSSTGTRRYRTCWRAPIWWPSCPGTSPRSTRSTTIWPSAPCRGRSRALRPPSTPAARRACRRPRPG